MSYLVLARKFRPQTFSEVAGQEHITKTLANAIKRKQVAHAFMFAGPRGVGKTSLARILAKALNCKEGPTSEPCGKCSNCIDITNGSALAVREIDGASHNSVDDVRDLIDSFRSLPPPGWSCKVYIIDEVHMLSTAAFNALLKSLEEPPPDTKFILATTEIHKIPETVLSRCQRYDFRAISVQQIQDRLKEVVESEKIKCDMAALRLISRCADGSLRDAQSLLERVMVFSEGKITINDASQVLGIVEREVLISLLSSIIEKNPKDSVQTVSQIFSTGVDPLVLLREFVSLVREVMLVSTCSPQEAEKIGIGLDDSARLKEIANQSNLQDLLELFENARNGADQALRSNFPRASFESLAVRLSTRDISFGHVRAVHDRPVSSPSTPVIKKKSNPEPELIPPSEGEASPSPVENLKYDWGEFIGKHQKKLGLGMVEHLKRLEVLRFESAALEARGPDFSVTYILQSTSRAKLMEELQQYSGKGGWLINLTKVEGKEVFAKGSIKDQEILSNEQAREKKVAEVKNSEKFKALKERFPGSEIESVK